MKKVVLLAGVIAAGMAAAPTAANAAAPADKQIAKAPLWASPSQDAFIASVQAKQTEYEAVMNKIKNKELYPDLAPAVRENFVNQLNNLIYGKFVSSSDRRGTGGVKPTTLQQLIERAPYVGAFSYGDWESLTGKEFNDVVIALDNVKAAAAAANEVAKSGAATDEAYKEVLKNILGAEETLRPTAGITPESKKTELDGIAAAAHTEYLDALQKINDASGIDETKYNKLLGEIKEYTDKVKEYNTKYDAAKGAASAAIKAQNAAAAASVNHNALDAVLEEALDILGAYDVKYQDPAGDKSDIYDAEIYGGKDGAINTKFDATVKGQIQAAIDLIYSINHAGEIDDELISAFELQNDVNTIADLLEGSVITFKIEANHEAAKHVKDALTEELGALKHHQDCTNKDTHNVANEIQNVIDQLDPDAAWDAKTDLLDRSLTNPKAVLAWEAHLNGTSIAEVSGLYKKALGWDVVDLQDAINAFATRFNALAICDVKNSIGTFLWTGKTVAGTIAKEYEDLKNDIAALGTTVTPAQFAALDQRVTNLYKRIANVEKAWEDLAKLNADDAALQKEITDAAGKDGYTSTAIKNKWTTEQTELDALEGQINTALLAITKDKEFTGYNTFDPTIKLEKDHHAWLAEYQKANYEATQTMIAAIDVRWEEYKAAKDFKITTTEKDTQKLADGTEVYTTKRNIDNGYTLETTKGEADPSKTIYASFGDHLGFSHIDAHFTDHISGLSGAPGHDGMTTDIRYDRINKWYNDAEAEYLGSQNYTTGWAEAGHFGKLLANTGYGVNVETTKADASAILVATAGAKNSVVFGWLQKEIYDTFNKAIENEKANKDLHDQIDACQDYVDAAKTDIDTYAKINGLVLPSVTYGEYDMATRQTTTKTDAAKSWGFGIKWQGTPMGHQHYEPAVIPDAYAAEGLNTVVPPVKPTNYENDFACGHDSDVWGWTKIATEITALWDKEKAEYDKVASKALLDSKVVEEKIEEIEENVDDIKNEAYTRVIKNGFARVIMEINEARTWAKGLDTVCDEEASTSHKHCSDLDAENNPCGWHNATAKGALEALIADFNDKLALLGTEHNAENNDDHATPVVSEDNILEFKGYLAQMLKDLTDWKVKFAAADKAHKVALNDALDLANEEAHTVHHYSYDAKLAMANFSDDGADAAAAAVWAKDFNNRTISTYIFDEEGNVVFKGQEGVTFKAFFETALKAAGHGTIHPEPDVLAAAEKVAADGIQSFADYVEATAVIEDILKAYAKGLYDHHHYTDLKNLAEAAKAFNWNADFNKKLEANKDTHAEYVETLGDLQTEVKAIEIAEAEVYGAEYTGEVANTKYSELDGLRETLNNDIDALLGKVNDEYLAGKCDEYAFNVTAITTKIAELKTALEAAKKLYAENVAAKNRLTEEVATIKEANDLVKVAIADAEIYGDDRTIIDGQEVLFGTNLLTEGQHIANGFAKGTLAANEAAEKEHILNNLIKVNENIADLLLKATKRYADNKAKAAELTETVNNLVDVVRATVPGDVYEDDLEALADANAELMDDLYDEIAAIAGEFAAGTVLTNEATIAAAIGELSKAVFEYQSKVKTAESLYAANVTARTELNAQLDAFQATVNAIELNEDALYGDDYTTLDGQLGDLNDAIDTVRGEIAAAFTAKTAPEYSLPTSLASDLAALQVAIKNAENVYAANVLARTELTAELNAFQATVNAIELNEEALYGDDYTTLDGQLGDLNDAIDTVRGEIAAAFTAKTAPEYSLPTSLASGLAALKVAIKNAENLYAANVLARTEKSREISDLEVALNAVMLDAKQVYDTASHKDFEALENMAEAIQTKIDNARTGLADAFDHKTAPEFIVDATIASDIMNLKTAVSNFEEFKRQNFAHATQVYNDLTNILTELEALKDYGTVYEDEVEGGYDKTHIDRQIETLVGYVANEVELLKGDLEEGSVITYLEEYEDVYNDALDEIENIKEAIEYAEQLWAANYRALNNLEEHIKAVETVLHTTKAMCACSECNEEDMEAVQGHLDTLADILDAVNESFSDTKDLAMQEGAFNGQIEDVEADVANLLALIQLHLDRVQNDLRVYNTLQTLLVSVDAEMLNLEAEEGYEHFKIRGAHLDSAGTMCQYIENNSNPNVKYGNELAQMVEDLKAEIERQHSHEGGHSCEEHKIEDVKAMNEIKAEIEKTIAAIKANEAAHQLLKDRFAELFEDAKDAYNFWHQYYSTATLITHEGDIANWIQEWNGELENGYVLAGLENLLHDYYVHGNAANVWTVDGKGEELNGAANDKFAEYDEALAHDRNELAHTEALNHAAQVTDVVMTYVNNTEADYTAVDAEGWTLTDPFVKEIMEDWRAEVTGAYGLIASLNYYKEQIELAYEEGVMEDAINIDEHNSALGIHQQLDGILGVLTQIEAEYAVLFENAHHLTNGKTVYSDMEYYTIGFFRKANEGLGEQAQEMFKTVKVHYDPYVGNIGIYDMNWLETEAVDPGRGGIADEEATELPEFTQDILVPVRDEQDHLVHQEGLGVVPAKVGVLTVGSKSNELTFTLHEEGVREVRTLAPGAADITFQPGSLTVYTEYNDAWTTKHPVFIEVVVEAPQVENDVEVDATTGSNKLSVRFDAPLDLTYTINSLVAKTDKGEEITFADRQINYAKGTVDFELPEGTEFVELPAGFFTFRTGENTIARSAAATVYVGNLTSIDTLIAMGEKAEIFDLQGRRVKAESLLSGNAYIVNGEKVMVK